LSTHLSVDAELRAEADRVLDAGLRDLLATYGDVHVIGSYALELMTWRDLDIHIVREPLDRVSFFELGGRIAELLEPHRMHFRDETVEQTAGLPRGLYWGIYLAEPGLPAEALAGAWKIDIWATARAGFEPVKRYCDRIRERLTPETRDAILAIKSAVWQHPEYRRRFSSADIYDAVLDQGMRRAEEFQRRHRLLVH
jgi:hypothetical protein